MTNTKNIWVLVSSDLQTDQRVHKICNSIQKQGYKPFLLGRLKRDSNILEPRGYVCKRIHTYIEKGVFFYIILNFRFLVQILISKSDGIWANDLDTLPAAVIAAFFKRIPVVYDSHELFIEVPELQHSPFKKNIWKLVEKLFIKRVQKVVTVNRSISLILLERYQVKAQILRNVPLYEKQTILPSFEHKTIIYQGAINVQRGLEELIEALAELPEYTLLIAGKGDLFEHLKIKTSKLPYAHQIKWLGSIPFHELKKITAKGSIGVSLEKANNMNYQFCLPNKIFDYIQAGLPVLSSNLVEMKNIVETYQIGQTLQHHSSFFIADAIRTMHANKDLWNTWQLNCLKAAEELNWEKETEVLGSLLFEIYGKA